MRNLLHEIWESVRRNKLRTCLTGFAVSWGIFMLIVLLGTGNGLMNSFDQNGSSFASNTASVSGGYTSKPYDGLKAGRRIRLNDGDLDITSGELFAGIIDDVVATVGTRVTVSYRDKSFSGYMDGEYPAIMKMEKIELKDGRFINEMDIRERRKVVVLPESTATNLLEKGEAASSLVGEYIKAGGLAFRVVGITRADHGRNDNFFYAPFSTVKTVFGKGEELGSISFTFHGLDDLEANEAFEKQYKAAVNLHHRAAPDDNRALWVFNRYTSDLQMKKGRRILDVALWIIGLFTLLGGIVGVSNIMLITVKERTHEIGIRKALGATPGSITMLMIAESVSITAIFGYIGMVLGMVACSVLDKTVGQQATVIIDMEFRMLVNPGVGVSTALEATAVLIIAGTLAGLIPARKAARVRPIEALRAE